MPDSAHPEGSRGTCPVNAGRRSFVRSALGARAGAAALAGGGVGLTTVLGGGSADAADGGRAAPVAFHGGHQAGITTPPPAAAAFVSFDVIAETRAELAELFRTVTDRARFLTAGGDPTDLGVGAPPSDSGILGATVPADALTVTVGVGSSLFDDRFGLASQPPGEARLQCTSFPNDNLHPARERRRPEPPDLRRRARTSSLHALRDLAKHTRGAMQPRWRIDGFHEPAPPIRHATQPARVQGRDREPGRTADTTQMDWPRLGQRPARRAVVDSAVARYQVVRIIRMLVEFWDRVSLARAGDDDRPPARTSGAPLDGARRVRHPRLQSRPARHDHPARCAHSAFQSTHGGHRNRAAFFAAVTTTTAVSTYSPHHLPPTSSSQLSNTHQHINNIVTPSHQPIQTSF